MRRIHEDAAYGPLADGTNLWRTTVAPRDRTPPLQGTHDTDIAASLPRRVTVHDGTIVDDSGHPDDALET